MANGHDPVERRVQSLLAELEGDNARFGLQDDLVLLEAIGAGEKRKRRVADPRRLEQLASPSGGAAAKDRFGAGGAGDASIPAEPSSPTRKLSPREQDSLNERLCRPRSPNSSARTVYLHGAGAWSQPSGGRFSQAKPKSWVEHNIYLKRDIPGPATYADAALQSNLPKGGRFNTARPPSALDLHLLQQRDMPGPGGHGEVGSTISSRGVGKVQMSRGKTHLDWEILRAKELPGPGQYKQADLRESLGRGGRFGQHNPASELDKVIRRAKELPSPNEYYPEYSYQGPPVKR